MNQDQQFNAVIAAVANFNRRLVDTRSPEEIERDKRLRKMQDPKHRKAVERRKKRKRGGPK